MLNSLFPFFFHLLLLIKSSETSSVSKPSVSDVIMECNKYYRYMQHGGGPFLFTGSRSWALNNLLIHDVLNVIDPQFDLFFNNIDSSYYDVLTKPSTKNNYDRAAIVVGICHNIRLWNIDNSYDGKAYNRSLMYSNTKRLQLIDDANTFFNNLYNELLSSHGNHGNHNQNNQKIENGYNYGVELSNVLLDLYNNDGWNKDVDKILGTFPYQPGKWFSSAANGIDLDSNIGMVYPQFTEIIPLGIGNFHQASQFQLPDRPALDTKIFEANYQVLYNSAHYNNPYATRTELETLECLTIGVNTPTQWNNLIVQDIIDKNKNIIYKEHDIAYLFAQQSLNSYDSVIWVYYWKKYYQRDRPLQLIKNGGGNNYPQYVKDETFIPVLNIPPHPEYPGGHTTESSTGIESIRLALYTLGILNSEDDDVIPNGPYKICHGPYSSLISLPNPSLYTSCSDYIAIDTFSSFKNKVARARVIGSLHYTYSDLIGKNFSSIIAGYNNANHMRPLN